MSDEYTPTDEDVYGVWRNYQCFYADDGYGPRGLEQAAAELDRYLARVRAEAVRAEYERHLSLAFTHRNAGRLTAGEAEARIAGAYKEDADRLARAASIEQGAVR